MVEQAASQQAEQIESKVLADLALLNSLLDQIVVEYGGTGLLADVDHLLALAQRATSSTVNGAGDAATKWTDEAVAYVAGLEQERAEHVAHAFTCYFHIANLCEERERVRLIRRHAEQSGQVGAMAKAYLDLEGEVGSAAARAELAGIEFRPVFTAHPTEARRRSVFEAVRAISELLDARDDARLGPRSLERNRTEMLAALDRLWRTAPLRDAAPSPLDEVRSALTVVEQTFVSALPEVYRRLDDDLAGARAGTQATVKTGFVRLGTWIGGDRDGNPYVTARVTRDAAQRAHQSILAVLEDKARHLARTLTVDDSFTPPSGELRALWARQRTLAPEVAEAVAATRAGQTHRRVLGMVARRVAATSQADAHLAYRAPDELLGDLLTVQASLEAGGDPRAAYGELQDFIWLVQSFGFHLAEMEIRQHSSVHAKALLHLADPRHHPTPPVAAEEVLEVFRTMAMVQARYGVDACRRYIVSFTKSAADIAAVHELALWAVGDPDALPVLDVIPLFETHEDLLSATKTLEQMIQLAPVRKRLEENGRRLEVMLGYSDSAKDVGPVAATLALYQAQADITQWAQDNDIVLTLFHGRGGALGRGGGPAERAILAQPPHSVDGRFKLTEQGEVINARYGDPEIAVRHLEHVTSAILRAQIPSLQQQVAEAAERFAPVGRVLDEASRAEFLGLVQAEGFAQWFAKVTPQEEVGHLELGSRPARRGLHVESLEDLRAIPWNFAWSQARLNLTAWYGLGAAIEAVGDIEELREAYRSWPLLRTLIDNIEMSLAKADVELARRFLALGERPELTERILAEFERTVRGVMAIKEESTLLGRSAILRRAIEMRHPYISALSILQLRALTELRGGGDTQAAARLMSLTLKGVAAGLQNTG